MSDSLRRGVRVLDALRSSPAYLSAREIAAKTGLAKSTVQRLLRALESTDMVVQEPRLRKYHLGPRTLALGLAYRSRLDLRGVALPHMTRLRDLTGEMVGLTVRIGAERMYLDQVQSRCELRTAAEIGRPYPLWSGAPGRVLLAAMPDQDITAVLHHAGPDALGVTVNQTEEAFWAAIRKVRERGYAAAFGETIPGINTLAAPIRDASGNAAAVLSISGSSPRFTKEAIHKTVPELIRTAQAITTELGGI